MGHDHQQSSSSGVVIVIVAAVLLVAILGIIAVAGAGLLLVRGAKMEQAVAIESRMADKVQRAKAEEQRAIVELHGAETVAKRAVAQVRIKDGMVQVQQSSVGAIPDPRLNFDVTLDREGNASVDGEEIDLDELRARLAKLKDETSNVFSVRINADSDCPVKLLIPVLDVCEEAGGIDFRVASSGGADSSPDEGDAR